MLHSRDRMAARVPDFGGLGTTAFHGHIAVSAKSMLFESGYSSSHPKFDGTKPKLRPKFVSGPKMYGIGLNRPLYGSHDAPLRWHLRITKAMIRHQFLPLHLGGMCIR